MVLFVTQSFALLQGIPLLPSQPGGTLGPSFARRGGALPGCKGQQPTALCKSGGLGKSRVRLKIRATTLAFFQRRDAAKQGSKTVDEAWPFAPPAGLFTSRLPAAPSDSPDPPDPPDPPGCGCCFSTHQHRQHRQHRWALGLRGNRCCVWSCLAPRVQVVLGDRAAALGNKNFLDRVSLGQDVSIVSPCSNAPLATKFKHKSGVLDRSLVGGCGQLHARQACRTGPARRPATPDFQGSWLGWPLS